ncbi:L-ascorbate oxidase [Exaiptasia diaphana]|nr:L-ascorbate oxidase [Exaiptasia diaphana]
MTYATKNTKERDETYNVRIAENGSLELFPNDYHRQVPDIVVPADKVHTVDGHTRTIITINDQFPGPAIEVMQGAQVVVTVLNELQLDGLTIHFHGIHMKYNPWMDGTAHVSQCPIGPKQSFQYRFVANPAGTHWYHSHLEAQRADGLFGPLIVHRFA